MKKLLLFLIALLFTQTLFSADKLEKITLQLDWKYQFEFAGFIAAKEKGFYKDVGLEVDLLEYENNFKIIQLLKDKKVNYAVFDSTSIYTNYKDKPLILLANYFKRSALVIVTKQDIYTPLDLIGRKFMTTPSELKNTSIDKLFNKFGLEESDFDIVRHTFNSQDFIDGKVDAMTAYISNELFDLREAKIPFNVIDPSSFGILSYGLNLISLKEEKDNHEARTIKFIEATNRGWEYALTNKDELIDIIYDKYSKIKTKKALKYESIEVENLMLRSVYEIGSIPHNIVLESKEVVKEYHELNLNLNYNDLIFDKQKKATILNVEEMKYLQTKKVINLCIDPNWMPLEKIEKGEYVGISKEYMSIFEKELKTPIKLIPTINWSQSLAYIEARKCDILSLAMDSKKRQDYVKFTQTYLDMPLVVATKFDELFIADINSIIGKKTLGIVKDYAIIELIKKKYPNSKIIEVDSIDDGLEKVSKGELFGFVDTLATIGYKIQQGYLSELKIAGKFDDKLSLSMAVRSDEEILLNIFNKLITNFDSNKKYEILNKWINVKYDKGIDFSLIWKIILVFLLVVIALGFKHKLLVNKNIQIENQKDQLKDKNLELKLAHNRLAETLAGFQTLLDSTIEAVFVFEKGICLDVNKSGIKLFGYDNKEELLGRGIGSFLTKESKEDVANNMQNNTSTYEVNMLKKDGSIFPAYVQGRNAILNGKAIRISTAIDVSSLKEKERLLMKQSKMASMGEMIGNIAHQWRQPLSMISTISTGIAFKMENDMEVSKEEVISDLNKLNSASQLLSKTIDDFRNFFLPDKEVQEFSMKDLVGSNLLILEPLFKSNYIQLKLNYDKEIVVKTYQNELTQALLNILTNANDALMSNNSEERYVSFKIYKTSEHTVIEIHDNAGGILGNMDRIFEPYYTTKHQTHGTGIGLYMSHQIIVEHIKGKIEVSNSEIMFDNKSYVGALFKIYLPI